MGGNPYPGLIFLVFSLLIFFSPALISFTKYNDLLKTKFFFSDSVLSKLISLSASQHSFVLLTKFFNSFGSIQKSLSGPLFDLDNKKCFSKAVAPSAKEAMAALLFRVWSDKPNPLSQMFFLNNLPFLDLHL